MSLEVLWQFEAWQHFFLATSSNLHEFWKCERKRLAELKRQTHPDYSTPSTQKTTYGGETRFHQTVFRTSCLFSFKLMKMPAFFTSTKINIFLSSAGSPNKRTDDLIPEPCQQFELTTSFSFNVKMFYSCSHTLEYL